MMPYSNGLKCSSWEEVNQNLAISFLRQMNHPVYPLFSPLSLPSQNHEIEHDDSKKKIFFFEQTPLNPLENLRKQELERDSSYSPESKKKRKQIKIYEKDDNRNIIPNIVNQLFSFLQKKYKSELLLRKLVERMENIEEKNEFISLFYKYHKFLKSKLTKHLNHQSLRFLCIPSDEKQQFFTLSSQRKITKINILLSLQFLKGQGHLLQILSAKKIGRKKLPTYLKAKRKIKENISQYAKKFFESQ